MLVADAAVGAEAVEVELLGLVEPAEALAALERAPDVRMVITDYNMPEMDGLSLLSAMRGNPATQQTGFLLITGRADASVIKRGRSLGMNNCVRKPFTPDDMKGAIEAVFGRL